MPPVPAKKWYDSIAPSRRLLYTLLIASAPALLVWAYFDNFARIQDAQIAHLRVEVQKLADQQAGPFVAPVDRSKPAGTDGKMRPPKPEGWATADGGAYLIDLPPGYVLRVGENGYDAIHSDPMRDDDLAPYAVIRELPASQEAEYADAGGRLLIAGDSMYWMSLYENLEWKDFDQAAASLRLK